MSALRSITFAYRAREDRVLAAVNLGQAEAWSCWLTRRLSLAVLERAAQFLATTSPLAQHAAPDQRHEVAAFERDAALATTAQALSATPTDALSLSAASAELADRLTITQQGQDFRFELTGDRGGGAMGMVLRPELQRILRMLEGEVIKAGWVNIIAASAPVAQEGARKPARH
jgi:hypothetical protein